MIGHLKKTLVVSILFFLVGCVLNVVSAEPVDEGSIKDGIYENEYLGITIKIPDGWETLNIETKNEIQRRGKEVLAGDNKNMKAALTAAESNVVQLLTISKYPLGTPGKPNVLFASGAENVSAFPGIENGKDYLLNAKELLKFSNMNMQTSNEIYSQKIDGVDFAVLECSINFNNNEVKQLMYATIIKGYAYYFNYTYCSPQDLQFLHEILGNMKFKQELN